MESFHTAEETSNEPSKEVDPDVASAIHELLELEAEIERLSDPDLQR